VQLTILFGEYKYHGTFHVLEGDVPLILGIDFLVKCAPHVDWKCKKVTCYVNNKKYILPTCSINSANDVTDHNSFAGLPLDDVDTCITNSQPELGDTVTVSKNSNTLALGESL